MIESLVGLGNQVLNAAIRFRRETIRDRRKCLRLVLMIAACAFNLAAAQAELRVGQLRCEGAVDPLGIDVCQPRFSWTLESAARGTRQTAYEILVASSADRLAADDSDRWSSGKVDSDQSLWIPYAGQPLASSQQVFWKVRAWDDHDQPSAWSPPATITMGILRPEDWPAHWIAAPWTSESLLVRREFQVKPGLRWATAHVCGLGQFELSVNGRKSGQGLLAPGWSKYDRTVLYETHDLTPMIHDGLNAVGLALGDGMYNTEHRNRYSKFQRTFGPLRAIAQIELEYADGARESVVTDGKWRVHAGPVIYNDVYGGEDYDARRAQIGWNLPNFKARGWAKAVVTAPPAGQLRGMTSSAPAVAAIETIRPVATKRISDTRDVVDLGQNASYMPRIRVTGPTGSIVRLTHAEILRDDGQIDRSTCGGGVGPAWWQYSKATDDPETWFPQFFYAGCRYLQVDKFPAKPGGELPQLDELVGVVVHSTAEPVGEFRCSNELLNRIHTLVRWAQRSNMVSVLTDCPHREKLGWLEQYHLNGPAIRYEFDVSRIFRKSLRDMADSQTKNGLIPNTAPEYAAFPGAFRAACEWGSAVILVPWQQYLFTGDTALLDEYYGRMQKYLDHLAAQAEGHIVSEGLGDWYDFGPTGHPGSAQLTPPPVTATAFYFYDAHVMSQIARVLGKKSDAEKYAQLAHDIRAAWLAKYRIAETGTYATGSQCANAIALVMQLALPADREKTLTALVEDVRHHDDATTAGDVGFRYLLQALAQGGRSDVVYSLISQDKHPGYAYQLNHGATSLTEAWDADRHSSHNHFMLGQINEWFYKDLVGIDVDPEGPGFKKIVIRPTPVDDLAWAEATYKSVRGPIAVRWDHNERQFKLAVTIPANTSATVYVPAADESTVLESHVEAAKRPGVRFLRRAGDRAVYAIESGSYVFESEF